MENDNLLGFKKGKKPRRQLELPTLYFVATDDWIDKLGYEGFGVWLKFHSWVDRKDADREYDLVPNSIEKLAVRLSVSKSKLYRLLKPLWEYGLIDIVEFEDSKRKSQKPKNVIVYDYPFNDPERVFADLEKLRDWDKDYESSSKEYGKTGGRPRKVAKKAEPKTRFYRGKKVVFNRFNTKTVDRFKIKTVTVSKLKPNNVLNISNNTLNNSNNYIQPIPKPSNNNLDSMGNEEKVDKVKVKVDSLSNELYYSTIPTKLKNYLRDKLPQLARMNFSILELERFINTYPPFKADADYDDLYHMNEDHLLFVIRHLLGEVSEVRSTTYGLVLNWADRFMSYRVDQEGELFQSVKENIENNEYFNIFRELMEDEE